MIRRLSALIALMLSFASCILPKSKKWWQANFKGEVNRFDEMSSYWNELHKIYPECDTFLFEYNTHVLWQSCLSTTSNLNVPDDILGLELDERVTKFMGRYNIRSILLSSHTAEFVFFGFVNYKIIKHMDSNAFHSSDVSHLYGSYFLVPSKDTV